MKRSGEASQANRPLVVLLVDDHLPLLKELPILLERHAQLRVEVAATAEQALGVLADRAVDVVVADLWLAERGSGADGGNLLDAVARWWPNVGRILFSVDSIGQEIARSGRHHWFDKERPVAELVRLIQEVSKRGG